MFSRRLRLNRNEIGEQFVRLTKMRHRGGDALAGRLIATLKPQRSERSEDQPIGGADFCTISVRPSESSK